MSKHKNNIDPKILEIANAIEGNTLEDLNEAINQIKKAFIEKALNAELENHLGYEKWDQESRTKSSNYRNGTYTKKVKSSTGNIQLNIPRDEQGTFEPKIVKKYQSDISGLDDKILAMYSKGMSNRDISEYVKEMYSLEISKDFISRVTDKVLPDILAWQSRPLRHYYPIVFIDGIRFNVKDDGVFKEKSVYIVMGINEDGIKEILGFWIGESESAKYWMNVFSDIKSRGVQSINIIVCDNLRGISEAIKALFQETDIQKCVVHQIRNAIKFVNYKDLKEFVNDMKLIYTAPNIEVANAALEMFEEKWSLKYKYATKSWRENFDELTTFFNYPLELRKLIYTTNPIENLNRNIRKITKSKGGMTSTKALEKLVYLAIQNQAKKWTNRIPNWGIILQILKDYFN